MPELSIIVPVYKVEKYLSKCIDSILAQTFTDFELILIDDGSPDRCGEICDEYAAKDSRIIVIHQQNKGVSTARNAGLKIAKGKYIGFVDSDDWIEQEMYEQMLQTVKHNSAEIVTCGMRDWDENGNFLRDILKQEGECDRIEMLIQLFSSPDQLGGSCCNKVFQRSAIADIYFPEDAKMLEDKMFLVAAYSKSKKNIKIKKPLYQVVEVMTSATRNASVEPLFDILESSKRLARLAADLPCSVKRKANEKYLDDCLYYLRLIKKTAFKTKEPWKIRSIQVKLSMIRWMMQSFFTRMISFSKVKGYMFGLLNL